MRLTCRGLVYQHEQCLTHVAGRLSDYTLELLPVASHRRVHDQQLASTCRDNSIFVVLNEVISAAHMGQLVTHLWISSVESTKQRERLGVTDKVGDTKRHKLHTERHSETKRDSERGTERESKNE